MKNRETLIKRSQSFPISHDPPLQRETLRPAEHEQRSTSNQQPHVFVQMFSDIHKLLTV